MYELVCRWSVSGSNMVFIGVRVAVGCQTSILWFLFFYGKFLKPIHYMLKTGFDPAEID